MRWLHEPQDVTVREGHDATIECLAKGYPEPIISWTKLNSDEDYSNYENNLHIVDAKAENSGHYECTAKNSAGEKLSKIISLSVIGKKSKFCATIL